MEQTVAKKQSAFRRAAREIFINYFNHGVGKHSAALAYYFMFSLFPFLIFLSNLIGLIEFDIYAVTRALSEVLPKEIVNVIESYLDHISHTSSHTLLWFSLVFTVWFPMRAAAGLMDDVRRAYGEGVPKNIFLYMLKQFVYTILLLFVIVLTLALTVLSKQVILRIADLFKDKVQISENLLHMWQYMRFLPIALLMMAAIAVLYSISLDNRPRLRSLMPGILFSLASWLVLSIGFSYYVENFSNHSLIYGTLGTVIILMIWLYLTALMLILGAELNAAIHKIKVQKEQE